jgi:hypothetical protein
MRRPSSESVPVFVKETGDSNMPRRQCFMQWSLPIGGCCCVRTMFDENSYDVYISTGRCDKRRSPPVPAPCSMRLRTMSTSPSPTATCNGDHLSLTWAFAYVLVCSEVILTNLLEGCKVAPEEEGEIKWATSTVQTIHF